MADIKIIHANADISVDPNCTTAFMTITAPENGGLEITTQKVYAAIQAKGIKFGLLEQDIIEAVEHNK